MIVGGAFLLGAVVMAWQGHRPLRRLSRGSWDARVLLAGWLVSLATVIILTIGAVTLLALPGHGDMEAILRELGRCWTDLQHGALPAWERGTAAVAAALLVSIGARLGYVALRQTRIRTARREKLRFLLSVASPSVDDHDVRWLDHPAPMAFSVAGRPDAIAVSRGLQDALSPPALAATVEHERAHLRGHHQLLVDIIDAAAATMPWAPLFREAPASVRELVELAADTAAVRRYGAAALAEALLSMERKPRMGTSVPWTTSADIDGTLSMSGTAVARRLDRLSDGSLPRLHTARRLWCVLVTIAIPAAPVLLGVELIVLLGCS